MAADSLRWLSRPRPRLVQSRWAVNSITVLVTAGRMSSLVTCPKQKGPGESPEPLCRPGEAQSMDGNIARSMRQHKNGFQRIKAQPCEGLTTGAFQAIISLTHPPRLSGFDRDAQPWRVFCAREVAAAYPWQMNYQEAG